MRYDIGEILLKILMGILGLLLFALLGLLGYVIYIEIRNANLNYEEIPKTAVVSELNYEPQSMTYIYSGKVFVPTHHSEKYNIYLTCEGNKYCIDDEMWFNRLKEGDSVEVILHEGHNSKGEVLNRYLTFAE